MSTEKKIKRHRAMLSLLNSKGDVFFSFFVYFLAINFLCTFFAHARSNTTELEKTVATRIELQERKWLEKFFRDIMLRQNGIYTLFGSKPMTTIVLDYTPQEQTQALIDQMSKGEKKDLYVVDESYDLPENWEKWEKIKDRFPLPNYLLLKMKREDDPMLADIYFVNIQQTALSIDENYDLFKKYVGEDFDPLEVVFEIGTDQSVFWQETMKNSVLLGILFGYGKRNAQCFDWKYWSGLDNKEPVKTFANSLQFHFSNHPKDFKSVSIKNFSLPYFASFSPPGEDEVIKKYEMERKKIQKAYKGKDFLEETLRKLTSQ